MRTIDNNRRCELIRRSVYSKDLNWFEKQELLRLQHQACAEIVESMRPRTTYLKRHIMAGLFHEEPHGLNERAMEITE